MSSVLFSLSPVGKTFINDESGIAIFEFSMAVLFLIILLFGVVNISSMLLAYMKLTQITDEALRTLSSIPGLQETAYHTEFGNNEGVGGGNGFDAGVAEECQTNPGSQPACGHLLAKRRIQFLFQTLDIELIQTSDITIKTELIRTGATAAETNTVTVSITAPFEGLLPVFSGFPVSATAQGPYLF